MATAPIANITISDVDQSERGNINLAGFINTFNSIVDAKEKAIADLQGDPSADFEDTKTVLLMQQMMNEWSFTLGLSSALAKTISDSLKGVVQKI
ncbi:hypothetical protein SG34_032880 [Thalassomonas viridans]|uniref:Uncharacterized protein n=1 Tax=Thalassomonas viridans TaxID=137584 RepID=A0AAE9ZA00_9GAMM|nr:EscF/YscF/HrpA family type III secretion system needle major subunit [Thalassomonas viridans]WDE08704.1 hypothetical protein SG34_032880 [Thalassomonas viridans]